MKVALTVGDFLDRAALVYGRRVALHDEPDVAGLARDAVVRPARGAGTRHGPRARRARGGARGAGGHREPELGPVPHLLLRGERVRPHPGADQLPAHHRRDRLRRGALRGVGPPVRPRSRRRGGHHQGEPPLLPGRDRRRRSVRAGAGGCDAAAVGARRGRHVLHQLHVGHHGAPEGCAADAPQLLAQRGDVRVAHRRERPGRAAAHAADVPLQRLGHALRGDRHGRRPRRAAQGRRRGDPVAHRAPRCDPPLRGPRRRGGHLERGRGAHRGGP